MHCKLGWESRLANRTHLGIQLPRVDATMIHCCLLHITFWATHRSISAFIAAISVLLSSFERISAILFELASDFYGVAPRATFPTEKCAVLILGAHEGAHNYSSHGN